MEATGRKAMLRRAVRRETNMLRALPYVTHVTVGEKLTDGMGTGRLAMKVYVSRKGGVSGDEEVPRLIALRDPQGNVIGEAETDVIETGTTPVGFGLRSGHILEAFDHDLGVAGLTFTKGGVSYVITNAHVACDIGNDGASGRVAWRRGGGQTSLGPVIYWTPMAAGKAVTADAAVVRLDDPGLIDPLSVDLVDIELTRMDIIRPQVADYWFVAGGALFRCTEPEPADGENPALVDGVLIHYRGFWQLRMTQGEARKGLSGSLLCRTVDGVHVACGLIFGGLVPGFIWAYPFQPLYQRIYNNLPG